MKEAIATFDIAARAKGMDRSSQTRGLLGLVCISRYLRVARFV